MKYQVCNYKIGHGRWLKGVALVTEFDGDVLKIFDMNLNPIEEPISFDLLSGPLFYLEIPK